MPKDPHQILGISEGATIGEIKKAYREKAREHHPDNGGDARLFKKVKEAYDFLLSETEERQKNPTSGPISKQDSHFEEGLEDTSDTTYQQSEQAFSGDTKSNSLNFWSRYNISDIASSCVFILLLLFGSVASYLYAGWPGELRFLAWLGYLFLPALILGSAITDDKDERLGNWLISGFLLIPTATHWFSYSREPFFIQDDSIQYWLKTTAFLGITLKCLSFLFGCLISDPRARTLSKTWVNLLFALGVLAWLWTTPERAFTVASSYLLFIAIECLAWSGAVSSAIKATENGDNVQSVCEANNCGILASLAVITLMGFTGSYPSLSGHSSFENAYQSVHPILVLDQEIALEGNKTNNSSKKSTQINAERTDIDSGCLVAAAFKMERERLYFVTSSTLLERLSSSLDEIRTHENKQSILAIALFGREKIPVTRLALPEGESDLVLLEVDTGDFSQKHEVTLIQFPGPLEGGMVADAMCVSFTGKVFTSTRVVIQETEGNLRLDRTNGFRFKYLKTKSSRAEGFMFGWPFGKKIHWLGIVRPKTSDSDECSAIGSGGLLRERFKWFDLYPNGLEAALAKFEKRRFAK
jgi:hypothetical protein